jgi:hypothetical protein
MEKHQQALTYAIACVSSYPQSRPLTQSVGASRGAAVDGFVNTEVNLDDSRGAVFTGSLMNRGDFSYEDDACRVRHLAQSILNRLWSGGCVLSGGAHGKSQNQQ